MLASKWIHRVGLALTLGLTAAIGGVGCASDKAVIAQANQFHGGLEKAVMRDQALATYIQQVGDRIVDTAKAMSAAGYKAKKETGEDNAWMFTDQVQFHFVNSKTLNAFTTGGEHMYIYSELFQRCKNEDELAAVMAHEFAHVFGRHVQSGMNRQMWSMLGAGAVAAAGYAAGGKEHGTEYAGYGAGVGMAVAGLVNAGFSRTDEAEADQLGFDIYTRAGWDPDKFGDFFRSLAEVEAKGGGGGPEWMSNHPSTISRVKVADQRAQAWEKKGKDLRRPPVADATRFKQLQAHAGVVGKSMPTDASLANAKELLAALPRSCLVPDEPNTPDVKAAQQRLIERAKKREQLEQQQKQK